MSTNRRLLDDDQIRDALDRLDGWSVTDGRLTRRFEFASFRDAIDFMARAADAAEELDHHPDWSNTYRVVRVELWTHDLGGLSALDVQLAERMNQLAG